MIIFSYACTDGGITARSLSLTSKYLASVAAPFLYRTLSVAGVASIQRAYTHLSALSPERRSVYHLFLSDKPAIDALPDVHFVAPDPESLASVERHQFLHQTDASEASALPDIATALLRLLSPTLRTLACILFNPLQSAFFAHLSIAPFPFLTDLTLRLSERVLLPPSPMPFVRLPNLQRFHFASNRYLSTSAAPILHLFATTCPRLTLLRISDLRLMPGCAATLCRMLGRVPIRDQYGWMPSPDALHRVPRLPFRIRSLFVQLEELDTGGYEAHLLQRMAEMDYADSFVLLPNARKRTYAQWKEEWIAVTEGDLSHWEGAGV
ncbi:hypothetical protein EW146_g1106 [Bondarzewia mesenterica]|uniref:F-box domain-containing protein n=1 Tax=Bondarzewia mesenterica TaxID=1095465 RepID=A0A4S4M4Z2_9AGAM|nr:hypothetical protein EW146_g1106 [Bondarzewia mesenterica]